MQALEAANVCNLTDAQNAKSDLDKCRSRAERAEKEVKLLKEANLCNITDAQNAKQALAEEEQINAGLKSRINRERILLAVLVALFVISPACAPHGLLFFGPWLTGACMVFIPHLWQRASGFRFTAIR